MKLEWSKSINILQDTSLKRGYTRVPTLRQVAVATILTSFYLFVLTLVRPWKAPVINVADIALCNLACPSSRSSFIIRCFKPS